MNYVSFLFLLLIVGLYAGTFKLAALLYKRARLRWREAVIVSLVLLIVLGGGALLNRLSGDVIPALAGIAASVVIQAGVGAWYLANRAVTRAGEPLGSNRAALLALIAYAFLVPLAMLWAAMVAVMRH